MHRDNSDLLQQPWSLRQCTFTVSIDDSGVLHDIVHIGRRQVAGNADGSFIGVAIIQLIGCSDSNGYMLFLNTGIGVGIFVCGIESILAVTRETEDLTSSMLELPACSEPEPPPSLMMLTSKT